MSAPLRIQEDNFEDVDDSSSEEALSDENIDFPIQEDGEVDSVEEAEPLETMRERIEPPDRTRLSTIPEESGVGSDSKLALNTSEQFTSNAYSMVMRDQESFFRHPPRFDAMDGAASEKENSWEPSICDSPLPVVRPNTKVLAALNQTSSFLDVSDIRTPPRSLAPTSETGTPPRSSAQAPENLAPPLPPVPTSDARTPPRPSASESRTPTRSSASALNENARTPPQSMSINESITLKTSTPNSFFASSKASRRDLSMAFNSVSIIQPSEEVQDCRDETMKKNGGNEHPLSKSMLDQLAREDMNDTALLNALCSVRDSKARLPPRLPLATTTNAIKTENKENESSRVSSSRILTRKPTEWVDESKLRGNGSFPVKRVDDTPPSVKLGKTKNSEDEVFKKPQLPLLTRKGQMSLTKSQKEASLNEDASQMRVTLGAVPIGSSRPGTIASVYAPSLSPSPSYSVSTDILSSKDGESSRKLLTFKPPIFDAGFVFPNDSSNGCITIRNISAQKLSLSTVLLSGKGFKLYNEGSVSLSPSESYQVHITFTPTQCAFYSDSLVVTVLNAEHIRYKVPVTGSGGAASLFVQQRPNISHLRNGSLLLTTGGQIDVSFTLQNKGTRDAYVLVVARDKDTEAIMEGVRVLPSDRAVIMRRDTKNFVVHFDAPSDYGLGSSEGSRPGSSASNAATPKCFIQVLWGQEALRRRLKRFEEISGGHFTFSGLSYTDRPFLDEEKSAANTKLSASERREATIFDHELFQLGMRIIGISVVDNRVTASNPSLSSEALYRSVALEPDDATLIRGGGDASVLQDVTTISPSSMILRKK